MDSPLSDFLQSWQPSVPEPEHFLRDVWAQIEMRERAPQSWVMTWLAALTRPRVAAGMVAGALLVGALAGTWLSRDSQAETYLRSVNPYAMDR